MINNQKQTSLEERERAVKLNNMAVSMLELGEFKFAVRELAKALSYYQNVMCVEQENVNGKDDIESSSSCQPEREARRPLVEKLTLSLLGDQGEPSSRPTKREAIEIPKVIENDSSREATFLVCSIIVSNLSLGYQLLALSLVAEHALECTRSARRDEEDIIGGSVHYDVSSVRHLLVQSVQLEEFSSSLAQISVQAAS